MAELADALDLGSSTARCEGSSPFIRTETSLRVIYPGWTGEPLRCSKWHDWGNHWGNHFSRSRICFYPFAQANTSQLTLFEPHEI